VLERELELLVQELELQATPAALLQGHCLTKTASKLANHLSSGCCLGLGCLPEDCVRCLDCLVLPLAQMTLGLAARESLD